MADYINLIGAESVSTAGRQMLNAAEAMQSAASNMDGSLERHQRFMDDWLQRFETIIDKLPEQQIAVGYKQIDVIDAKVMGPAPEGDVPERQRDTGL